MKEEEKVHPVLASLSGSTHCFEFPLPVMTSTSVPDGANVSVSSIPVGQLLTRPVDKVLILAPTSLTSGITSLTTSTPSIRMYAEGLSHKQLKVLSKD